VQRGKTQGKKNKLESLGDQFSIKTLLSNVKNNQKKEKLRFCGALEIKSGTTIMLNKTMVANANFIYYEVFVFCSIPRLFVCLRMRMSTSKQYANVYVKSIFIGPRSIVGVPLSQAAPACLITAHHLCAFLLYSAC